jgi:hypothetical protein
VIADQTILHAIAPRVCRSALRNYHSGAGLPGRSLCKSDSPSLLAIRELRRGSLRPCFAAGERGPPTFHFGVAAFALVGLACQAVAQRAKAGGEGGIGSLRLVLRTRALRAPSSLRSVELRSHPSSAAAPRLPFRFAELPPLALQVAEREGFEPPEPCGSVVFKTTAIDHSATSPVKICCGGSSC